jgi:hypothetical protein
VVFGMARGLAADLAKVADVVESDGRLPQRLVFGIHGLGLRKVQHRPQQHGRVAVGQHEAVAIGPDRVLGVEVHHSIPDGVNQRRQRHRRAGMSRLGLLDGVHRKRANGVDAQLIDLNIGRSRRGLCGAHALLLIIVQRSALSAQRASCRAICQHDRLFAADPPGGNGLIAVEQTLQHLYFFGAGNNPKHAARAIERRIR